MQERLRLALDQILEDVAQLRWTHPILYTTDRLSGRSSTG
jgi:hypothetical protein